MRKMRFATAVAAIGLAWGASGCNMSRPEEAAAQSKVGSGIQSDVRTGAATPGSQAATGTPGIEIKSEEPAMPSLKGDYDVDATCNTCKDLHLKQIAVTDSKTYMYLEYTQPTGEWGLGSRIKTGAPGQETAFFIADPQSRAEYHLLNVDGIDVDPAYTTVAAGETVKFRLTFERIPDTLTCFHLIEGKVRGVWEENQSSNTWTFMNVKLR
jgi:hypothetical protein